MFIFFLITFWLNYLDLLFDAKFSEVLDSTLHIIINIFELVHDIPNSVDCTSLEIVDIHHVFVFPHFIFQLSKHHFP